MSKFLLQREGIEGNFFKCKNLQNLKICFATFTRKDHESRSVVDVDWGSELENRFLPFPKREMARLLICAVRFSASASRISAFLVPLGPRQEFADHTAEGQKGAG